MIVDAIFSYIYDKAFLYQLFATITTFSAIKLLKFVQTRKKRYQIFKYYGIPGPEPRLLDGNLIEYRKGIPIHKVDEQYITKYGKSFGIFIGDEPSIITTDLEILKSIFFDEGKAFTERTLVFIQTPIVHGILFAKYPRWKVMRKAMLPSFSRYNMRGDSSTQFIEESVKLMIDYINKKLDEAKLSNKKANIDIHDLMKSTALHLISAMAVKLPNVQVIENEKNVKSLDGFLSNADKGIIQFVIMLPFTKPIFQFLATHFEHNKTLALIHRGVNKVIDDGLLRLSSQDKANQSQLEGKQQQQPQLIDTLIKLLHEGKLSRLEVMGNVEAILFAGYDTTSTTLAYIFWVLGKYPDVQERLRGELMAHGVESKYLAQVIKETMRLYPTVILFTSRLATKTVEIDKLFIPQGTRVIYHSWLMHRNPEIWPNPEQFDPERFKEGTDIHPCAYAPFGLGDRKCLGYQLAILEMKMIACDILLRYRLKLKSPQNLELVSYAVSLTKPKEKIIIELESLQD